jgi:hypothetical protein
LDHWRKARPVIRWLVLSESESQNGLAHLSGSEHGPQISSTCQAKQAAERSQLRVLILNSFKQSRSAVIFLVTRNPQPTTPTHL